jgi:hypothetical protein
VGWLDGHGWHCHCDDDLCREMAKKIWRLKREATAKQIADLQRELLERHLITREDAQQLGLFG